MFDPSALLDQFLGGRGTDGRRTGPSRDTMHGLAAGGIAGLLLGSKGGRKLAKGAVKLGGTAVLAGLAYKAYNDWQANKRGTVSGGARQGAGPEGTPFLPENQAALADLSTAVLRAMIAAAKSDGHIDATEQKRIFGKLDELQLGTEAKAFVVDELRRPLDIDAVVAPAKTPELATEIYAASVLAVDPDDPAEQAYLSMLAARLKLDPGLRASIEKAAREVSNGAT